MCVCVCLQLHDTTLALLVLFMPLMPLGQQVNYDPQPAQSLFKRKIHMRRFLLICSSQSCFFFFFFFSSASIGLHALCLASITTVSSHLKKQNNSPANSHKCGNRHKWWIHWRSEWEELKEWFVICIALQLIWFITGLGTFNDIKSMPLCGTF